MSASQSPEKAFPSIDELIKCLDAEAYLADRGLATAIYLAMSLKQPLLLEGEAGVGKTEVGKALAAALGVELIRLQCYEGIDASQALYEWDYARQLLHIRAAAPGDGKTEDLFGVGFLSERPLLRALRRGSECVLLIDEVDRADDEFEAFLLEILSDFQITIPEVGTVRAESPPIVIMTSNRTRELHDALKRRCLYHWIDYPTSEREIAIVRARAPQASKRLAEATTQVVARLREADLVKSPGVAETIGWAKALPQLNIDDVAVPEVLHTLGAVLKDHDDLVSIQSRWDDLIRDD